LNFTVDSDNVADMNLAIGEIETGKFGNNFDGVFNPDGVVSASFIGTGVDLNLLFLGFDVDFDDEIEVLLNGESLGFLLEGPNDGLASYEFQISTEQQLSGINIIEFSQAQNPNWNWGVTDILLDIAPPNNGADIALTVGEIETGKFGNNFDGVFNPDGVVSASFIGTGVDLNLLFLGFDVDFDDEIEVLLNGESLGFLLEGPNDGLASYEFQISVEQQLSGINIIEFYQVQNPNWNWGITNILLDVAPPDNLADIAFETMICSPEMYSILG
jgi:hypothetical protein